MSNQPDPPIIVSGGSVTVEFDARQLTPAGNGKHSNTNKKIYRVVVERNGTNVLDEGVPDGRVTVTIYYRDPGSSNP